MEPTTTETTTANETQTGMPWSEVAKVSAENDKKSSRSKRVTDVLKVPVTEIALAKIARDNAADDSAMTDLQAELDDLKEAVKGKKAKLDAIAERMGERHEAVRSGVQELRGEWILTDIFETNTVQYTDPETGLVVLERSMSSSERQQELPLGTPTITGDASADDEDEDEQADSAPPSLAPPSGDDGKAITDPDALLNAALATDEDGEEH